MPAESDNIKASCRSGCAACCTAPSISTPLPKHPAGKPAGMACLHLTGDLRCELFGLPQRPPVCSGLQPQTEMCGNTREEAMQWLRWMEKMTTPTANLPSEWS